MEEQTVLAPGDSVTILGWTVEYRALALLTSSHHHHHVGHRKDLQVTFTLPGVARIEVTREYKRRTQAFVPW